MLVKTNQLIKEALDWAVAKCEGLLAPDGFHLSDEYSDSLSHDQDGGFSTDWAQGGPIIDRELIETSRGGAYAEHFWKATRNSITAYGPTQLIAAMRCYVASKLGDEVEIPNEMLKNTDAQRSVERPRG
jgi:hypothetical protein